MNRKIDRVTNLFNETVRYSSKTYFYEEIQNHKRQLTKMNKKIELLEKRNNLYERQLKLERIRSHN